jgi:hypothetical protein
MRFLSVESQSIKCRLSATKEIFALLSLLMFCESVSAKCASEQFMFSGTALDAAGMPLSGALIGISWLEQAGVTGPALSQTDANGHYIISIAFDTYSGKGAAAEDQCNQKISSVSVVAQKGQFRSPYQRVSVDVQAKIRVPPLKVSLKIDENPAVRLIRPK